MFFRCLTGKISSSIYMHKADLPNGLSLLNQSSPLSWCCTQLGGTGLCFNLNAPGEFFQKKIVPKNHSPEICTNNLTWKCNLDTSYFECDCVQSFSSHVRIHSRRNIRAHHCEVKQNEKCYNVSWDSPCHLMYALYYEEFYLAPPNRLHNLHSKAFSLINPSNTHIWLQSTVQYYTIKIFLFFSLSHETIYVLEGIGASIFFFLIIAVWSRTASSVTTLATRHYSILQHNVFIGGRYFPSVDKIRWVKIIVYNDCCISSRSMFFR